MRGETLHPATLISGSKVNHLNADTGVVLYKFPPVKPSYYMAWPVSTPSNFSSAPMGHGLLCNRKYSIWFLLIVIVII